MLRLVVAFLSLFSLACRTPRADHLHTELSFLVPYVDMQAEAEAVERVLAQRKLVVEEKLERPHFVALSAATLNGTRSAVRIITRRGVVVGADADADDPFADSEVALHPVPGVGSEGETLLAVLKTARHEGAGCATLYRVLPDGRAIGIELRVERFGPRACINTLRATAGGRFAATLVWPSLSPFDPPWLELDLSFAQARLDRPDEQMRALVMSDQHGWLERETQRLDQPLPADAPFSQRHARGVAKAALRLAQGQGTEAQLGAYRSSLGRVLPRTPEADIVDAVSRHIAQGWLDEAPEPELDGEVVVDAGKAEAAHDADEVLIVEPEP